MQLKILRLHYRNIRDFPELDLDFTKPQDDLSPHHVSLVQMPNGMGKTTTITLLRKVLAGSPISPEEVRSFAPTKFSAERGSFEVELAYETKPFNLRLELEYSTGTYEYYNSKPAMKSGGKNKGHWLPLEIEPLIHGNDRFVHLFVFDGEQATKLMDAKETAADRAIRSIFFLDKLALEKENIEGIRERRRQKSKNISQAVTQQGVRRLQTELRNLEAMLAEQLRDQKELKRDIERIRADIAKKEAEGEQILTSHKDITGASNRLKDEIDGAESRIVERTRAALAHLRRPSHFSPGMRNDIVSLGHQMAVLKLPKATSAEFFVELSERDVCICGRPITAHEKQEIQTNAHQFLSEENITVLNAVKNTIRGLPEYESVQAILDEIALLRQQRDVARQKRDSLAAQLDPEAAKRASDLRADVERLKHEMRSKQDDLDLLSKTDKDTALTHKENIALCKDRIREFRTRIAEATGTVRFEKKATTLSSIIDDTIQNSMRLLKSQIVLRTNERIEKFLSHNEVRIAAIQDSIVIDKKGGVSEGQKLSVAYAFLSTLFENSPYQIPFVVDSPAVSIDLAVRREVSEMVPKLFKQMIVFIISSERPGFMNGIDRLADVQCYTVYRDSSAGPRGMNISTDRSFFDQFQSEDARAGGR